MSTWLVAVDRHEPGTSSVFSRTVARWSLIELQGLWIDFSNLMRLMRDQRLERFIVTAQDGKRTEVIYSSAQLQQLRALACVAGGLLDASGYAKPAGSLENECLMRTRVQDLTPDLVMAATHFGRERLLRGDDNLVLFRIALLHSDVAMRESPPAFSTSSAMLPIGPRRVRLELIDGNSAQLAIAGIHWEFAESALDHVRVAGSDTPAPGKDERVRAWYHATSAWMQWSQQYDQQHLDRALQLFPTDGTLLFLLGCQHETYASPAIQASRRSADGDTVGKLSESGGQELALAERYLSAAIRVDVSLAEARLHLGRVLSLRGRFSEAIPYLVDPIGTPDRPALRYYRAMFRGFALETQGQGDEARASYEAAGSLFPGAQTPTVALAQLALRGGLHTRAADLTLRLAGTETTPDPWWEYHRSHVENAEALVTQAWVTLLRRP